MLCYACTLCSAGHHLDCSVDHGPVHHCQPQGKRGMWRHGRGMGTEISSAGGASCGPSADSAVAHVWLTAAVLLPPVTRLQHYSVDVVVAFYTVPLVFYTMHRRWTTKRPVQEAW